jgi:WD40 repeat protein/transcriptional regulator with XRE-family HTH domain
MDDFGPTLDHFCKKQGITLKELANQVGISRNTISNWKANGKPPRREEAKKLARLLYLDEEETDILLKSAGYAPEYDSKESKKVLDLPKHLSVPNKKLQYQENAVSSTQPSSSIDIHGDLATANTPDKQFRIPFMVEDLPTDFVQRPNEFDALIGKLLESDRKVPTAITAALRGAGGFGKTTLAKALCHDPRIKETFHDGILWVTLGQKPGNLVGKIEDLIYVLSRERPGFTSLEAAAAHFSEQLADRDVLIVIDDVWYLDHLRPFLHGGRNCARLITTRDDRVLPDTTHMIQVDAMREEEALQLLSTDVPGALDSSQTFRRLSARIGEWPLLLKIVNGALRERVRRGEPLPSALAYIEKVLDRRGLTFFDNKNARDRSQAVGMTLNISFELLSTDQYTRYKELAILPEDVDVPLETVHVLWRVTSDLDDIDTEELCKLLYDLSLLLSFDLATRTIRLHDVVRTYLQQEVGNSMLANLHEQFLNAYGCTKWADLPDNEPYLWDYLAEHLVSAGRSQELVVTVKDSDYLSAKTFVRKAYAVEIDLAVAEKQAPTDGELSLLKHNFICMGHLLNRCATLNDVRCSLYARLQHLKNLSNVWIGLEQNLSRPFLLPWHMLPDLPNRALIRTLAGSIKEVTTCAISPNGDYIVSGSFDCTLKVWDARTGAERLTLYGHTDLVWGCAISPSSDFIVSAARDNTLKIWDAQTGANRLTLRGHKGSVEACAVSPRGDYIVSASEDNTLRVWDAQTGRERLTLHGHKDWVKACAISPNSKFIVSVSNDCTLRFWDAQTGACLIVMPVDSHLNDCVFHPDGEHIVAVGGAVIYFLRLVW